MMLDESTAWDLIKFGVAALLILAAVGCARSYFEKETR
jgi:hypothetical protein